jgi:hypothetical protein
MILGLYGGLHELRHHMRRGRQVRITHAEVHNILPSMPRLHFHAIDDAENVGREPLDPLKFHAPVTYPF